MAAGAFTATLDNNILNVCLPTIAAEFGYDAGITQFVSSAYTFTICSLLLIFAYLSPSFGRRNMFGAGTLAFAGGSIAAALSQNLQLLILSRILQGLGAAMFMANGMALISIHFDKAVQGRAFGIISSAIAVASITGPVVGGAIADLWGWRSVFFILALMAMIASCTAFVTLKADNTVPLGKMDIRGIVLSFSGIITVFSSFVYLKPGSVMMFAFIIICGAFLLHRFWHSEQKDVRPLLIKSLFDERVFVRANASSLCVYTIMLGTTVLLPFYIQQALGMSVSYTGLIMAVVAVAIFGVSYWGGAMADRKGGEYIVRVAVALILAGLVVLAAAMYSSSLGILVCGNCIFGIGIGLFNPANNKIVMGSVPREHSAMAAGINVLSRNTGIAVGTAMAGLAYSYISLTGVILSMAALMALVPFLLLASLIFALRFCKG